MTRTLAHTALAVLVIVGWLAALLWLVASVSQIAVERTVLQPCTTAVAVAAPGEVACR